MSENYNMDMNQTGRWPSTWCSQENESYTVKGKGSEGKAPWIHSPITAKLRHPRILPCVRAYQLSPYVLLAVLIFFPPMSLDYGWGSLPLARVRHCKCNQLRFGYSDSWLPDLISCSSGWLDFCPEVSMNKWKNLANITDSLKWTLTCRIVKAVTGKLLCDIYCTASRPSSASG